MSAINEDTPALLSGGVSNKILEKLKLHRGEESLAGRKYFFFFLVLWLPMLILSFYESSTSGMQVKVPFLQDYLVYARFFVALPILFAAERIVKFQTDYSIRYFIDSGIIADNNITDFRGILNKVLKLKNSSYTEFIILALAYSMVIFLWKKVGPGEAGSSWTVSTEPGGGLSVAGYWYFFVAAPVFQFFLLSMIWKFILWSIFMWKISRMKLNLYPTNPDLSAGLGFLGSSLVGFSFLGAAQSGVVAGEIANRIVYMGETLKGNRLYMITTVVCLTFLYLLPSLFFLSKLLQSKLSGILEYGVITSRQASAFYNKWIKGRKAIPEEYLDSPDFSSHTDLNTIFDIIQKMRFIPVEFRKILAMVLIIAAPFLPLAFLAFPLSEIVEFIFKIFL